MNRVAYAPATPPEVVSALDALRDSDQRVRLHYGDPTTGQDWLDTAKLEGLLVTVGNSVVLRPTKRSRGSVVRDGTIVRIRPTRRNVGDVDFYRHPSYFVDGQQLEHMFPDPMERLSVYLRYFA